MRVICKATVNEIAYYFEFSTIVDAPVTMGMSLEEFTEYYRDEYGRASMEFEFPNRMKRVEDKGTSSFSDKNMEEVIRHNRAGKGETCLTIEQLIETYCANPSGWNGQSECPIEGKKLITEDDY